MCQLNKSTLTALISFWIAARPLSASLWADSLQPAYFSMVIDCIITTYFLDEETTNLITQCVEFHCHNCSITSKSLFQPSRLSGYPATGVGRGSTSLLYQVHSSSCLISLCVSKARMSQLSQNSKLPWQWLSLMKFYLVSTRRLWKDF